MGALRLAALVITLGGAVPAAAEPVDRWTAEIGEASRRFGVPDGWIRRVMRAESGGRTHVAGRPIRSHAGAMGLMQLMPGTWREMRLAHGLGGNPDDPRDNILAGTAYLRAMYDRFGYPGLFAAYNAGPARYAEHVARGRRLPRETVAYVAAVAGAGSRAGRQASAAPERLQSPAFLFAIRDGGAASEEEPTAPSPSRRAPSRNGPPPSLLFVPIGAGEPR